MIIMRHIKEMKSLVVQKKMEGKQIGFVPTMGYLHEGHCSLIKRAREENDLVVVSVFVNPTQFGEGEDFERYPRNLERDVILAKNAGADVLFHPTAQEMYPEGFKTYVTVEQITDKLCGESRPGHFQGVTTVVNKLFHIVMPNRAYFGQKDAQQLVVIQQMVRDLNMDIEIIPCPIVREEDGLALSSRNVYLNAEERKAALILNESLMLAKKMIVEGEKNAKAIRDCIFKNISRQPKANIDYVAVVDAVTLEDIMSLEGNVLIALAVKIGKTRLIDNITINL